jgi:hypothetical protein
MKAQYEPVSQGDDEWGCGVACVASRLGISYAVAKKRLELVKGGSVNKATPASLKGLNLDPIVKVLRKAGVRVIADWYAKEHPIGTIVLISGGAPYAEEHYLLRVADGWMDPWVNMPNRKVRLAAVRKSLPAGTKIKVALLPAAG